MGEGFAAIVTGEKEQQPMYIALQEAKITTIILWFWMKSNKKNIHKIEQ